MPGLELGWWCSASKGRRQPRRALQKGQVQLGIEPGAHHQDDQVFEMNRTLRFVSGAP
jgi:hypothetical protein